MRKLYLPIVLTAAILLFSPQLSESMGELLPPPAPKKIIPWAEALAVREGIDWDWFYRLVERETKWELQRARGDGGAAYGFCQIHIPTARAWGGRRGSDAAIARKLLRPRENIRTCLRILGWLLKRYGGSQLLATIAFNGGTKHADYVREVALK